MEHSQENSKNSKHVPPGDPGKTVVLLNVLRNLQKWVIVRGVMATDGCGRKGLVLEK